MVSKLTTIVIAVLCLFCADRAVAQTDTSDMPAAVDTTMVVKKPYVPWSEVMVGIAAVGYGGIAGTGQEPLRGIGGAMFILEYRFAIVRNLTIGVASHFHTFEYGRPLCDPTLQKSNNVVASLIPRVNIRTSRSKSTSSLIIFMGPAFTFTSLTEACLLIESEYYRHHALTEGESGMSAGFNFGWGFETGSVDGLRLRLYFEVTSSSIDAALSQFSVAAAFGYAW